MGLQQAYIVLLLTFVFGTIIGSFANVFILRYGTGRSVGGRSSCAVCAHRLRWYELIPVASFLIQKGRCRKCDTKISTQYATVELLFGLLFVVAELSAMLNGQSTEAYVTLLFSWIIIFLLVSLSVYDLRHLIIPDGMVYGYIILSLVWGIWSRGFSVSAIGTTVAAGVLVALPLLLLWAVSRGRWMGFGDVKLAFGMGLMLGIVGGFSALIFGIWAGAIVSLLVIGVTRLFRLAHGGRHLTMKSEIPFGPFLVAGTLFVFFTNMTLIQLLELL